MRDAFTPTAPYGAEFHGEFNSSLRAVDTHPTYPSPSRMHRVSRTLLLIPLVVGATLPAQSADPVRALPYTRVVLPNGLTVILNEDHALPIVALDIFYKIGYRDDQPSLAGVSHFCEHIFTNGTSTLPQTMNAF